MCWKAVELQSRRKGNPNSPQWNNHYNDVLTNYNCY